MVPDLLCSELFRGCMGLGDVDRYTLVQHYVRLVCICKLVGNGFGGVNADRCVSERCRISEDREQQSPARPWKICIRFLNLLDIHLVWSVPADLLRKHS